MSHLDKSIAVVAAIEERLIRYANKGYKRTPEYLVVKECYVRLCTHGIEPELAAEIVGGLQINLPPDFDLVGAMYIGREVADVICELTRVIDDKIFLANLLTSNLKVSIPPLLE